MINPFVYRPCLTLAEFHALPAKLPLEETNGHVFIKRTFNPETQVAEYVWEDLLKHAYSALV